jgi:hypothetical protein
MGTHGNRRNLIGFLDAFKAGEGCAVQSALSRWFETRGVAALLTMRV